MISYKDLWLLTISALTMCAYQHTIPAAHAMMAQPAPAAHVIVRPMPIAQPIPATHAITRPISLTAQVAALLGHNPREFFDARAFASKLTEFGCDLAQIDYLQSKVVSREQALQFNRIFCRPDVQADFNFITTYGRDHGYNENFQRWRIGLSPVINDIDTQREQAIARLEQQGFRFPCREDRNREGNPSYIDDVYVLTNTNFPEYVFKIHNKNRDERFGKVIFLNLLSPDFPPVLGATHWPTLVGRILNAERARTLVQWRIVKWLAGGQIVIPKKELYCIPNAPCEALKVILVAQRLENTSPQQPPTFLQWLLGVALSADPNPTNILQLQHGIGITDMEFHWALMQSIPRLLPLLALPLVAAAAMYSNPQAIAIR